MANKRIKSVIAWLSEYAEVVMILLLAVGFVFLLIPPRQWGDLFQSASHLEPQFKLGTIIYIIDIFLLVVWLPSYIRRREAAKWHPMRRMFVEVLKNYFDEITAYPRYSGLGDSVDEKKETSQKLRNIEKDLRNNIIVLSSSIDSSIASAISQRLVNATRLATCFDAIIYVGDRGPLDMIERNLKEFARGVVDLHREFVCNDEELYVWLTHKHGVPRDSGPLQIPARKAALRDEIEKLPSQIAAKTRSDYERASKSRS